MKASRWLQVCPATFFIFFPLPQGQGSLRPIFLPTLASAHAGIGFPACMRASKFGNSPGSGILTTIPELTQFVFPYRFAPQHFFVCARSPDLAESAASLSGPGTRQARGRLLHQPTRCSHRFAPQHFLYFFPLPQGQGALRPIFWPTFTGFGFPGATSSAGWVEA